MQNSTLPTNSTQQQGVPLVNRNDYDVLQAIGIGSFARAFQAIDRKTEKCVLIKVLMKRNGYIAYDELFDRLMSLSSVGVSGTIQFLGYKFPLGQHERDSIFPEGGFIVTPFFQNGSLENHLRYYHKGIDKEQLNSTRRTKIIFGIAAIMKKLHSHKIIHRSLKPSQIILNENFEPLIDYSPLSKIITDPHDMTMGIGPAIIMAPEQHDYDSETYGLPVDVYAYGFLLYLMLLENVKPEKPFRFVSFPFYRPQITYGIRLIRDSCIPDCYWELIERCRKQNPEERLTFAEITEILKDDQYVLHDCGEPDLNEIHRYQHEIDN